ncbi:MAG TPA: (2Fe-2S)-binding protein [Caulobacteraceae bacterium]|jgi:xanthine dehydrogenase YagT iron-sulfur-binding subunit|nr:(2Fe-2S)-binding protein [Caulobacteraceae bacterium]
MDEPFPVSRRRVLAGGVGVAGASVAHADTSLRERTTQAPPAGPSTVAVELEVNGDRHRLEVDPRATLLDTLRLTLGLTGSKKGCDHGQCGACTVHVNGRRVLSCLTLAAAVRGPVTTIEGLSGAEASKLHPMQQAFVDQDAYQCGYCTPGQIMSAVACVHEGRTGSDADIREAMSGNLCRCAAYPHIVAAVKQAAPQIARG